MRCILSHCKNNTQGSSNISFFSINYNVRDYVFNEASRRKDIDYDSYMEKYYKNYKICSEHFNPEQIYTAKDGSRRLKPDMRPTQNLRGLGKKQKVRRPAKQNEMACLYYLLILCLICMKQLVLAMGLWDSEQ